MLYIVSTPIGNLQDITFRAIDTLKSCDYILCEDTRHSLQLLKHYGIEKRLVSFHEFNEAKKEEEVIQDLLQGKQIALISDAGTPLVCDPGERLVKRCINQGITVVAIPGASALIYALTIAGFETAPFQFIGFLPRKKGELTATIKNALEYPGITICYESPERIGKSLQVIASLEKTRNVCVARELTKKFETFYRASAEELADTFTKTKVKGEIVLLINQKTAPSQQLVLDSATMQQLVHEYQTKHAVSLNVAIKEVAKEHHLPKRTVYQLFHLPSAST